MNRITNIKRKILMIRFSSLGDIILTTPLIEAVSRRESPSEIEISFLTSSEFSTLLSYDQRIHKVISFDRKKNGIIGLFRLSQQLIKEGYDTVYDLHGSIRSKLICFFMASKSVKFLQFKKGRLKLWSYFLLKAKLPKQFRPRPIWRRNLQLAEAAGVFTPRLDFGNSKVFCDSVKSSKGINKTQLVISPSSKWLSKEWPADRFLDCARSAVSQGFKIAIIGLPSEKNVIQLKSKCNEEGLLFDDWTTSKKSDQNGNHSPLTLEELAGLLIHAHGLVCNDSGLMHFAEALSVPVFSVFGPTKPDQGFGPFRQDSKAITSDLWCSPCSKDGSACFRLVNRYSCIKNLKFETVQSQYSQWLLNIKSQHLSQAMNETV